MSLSRRSFLITLPMVSLTAGCGFTPLLKKSGNSRQLIGKVDVEIKDSRNDFEFRRALLERLGQPQSPRYQLRYSIASSRSSLSVSTTAEIVRFTLFGTLNFTLHEFSSESDVYSNIVRASAGYSATAEPFATRTAERDANNRLMEVLAEQTAQSIFSNRKI